MGKRKKIIRYTQKICTRLTDEEFAFIDSVADKLKINRNEAVRVMINYYEAHAKISD